MPCGACPCECELRTHEGSSDSKGCGSSSDNGRTMVDKTRAIDDQLDISEISCW